MTKTFEEIARPENGPITELNNNMQVVLSQYRKMREYATKLENKLLKKDEQCQLLLRKVEHMDYCEPQALPVVPECVGKWIECVKGKSKNALALLDDEDMPDDVNEWLFFQRNDDNINLILRAWLYGYTVEKPKTPVSPCPVCGYKDVSSNFCSICGHKNEYVEDGE